jgi:hypothetical protein
MADHSQHPNVYVHTGVNPPQNPAGLLQNSEYLVWQADLGQGPQTYLYKGGSWYPLSPEQVNRLLPPPAAPEGEMGAEPMAPAQGEGMEPSMGGTGAGTTRMTGGGTWQHQQEERQRVNREKELQKAGAVSRTQEAAAAAGGLGGLSIAERGQVEELKRDQGLSEEEAVAEVMKMRQNAGSQADALESSDTGTSGGATNLPTGPAARSQMEALAEDAAARSQPQR